MIDFVRIYYQDKRVLEHHVRTPGNYKGVYETTEVTTSANLYPLKTKYESMDIVIRANTAEVKNSLHQLYNYVYSGEKHNHNDFTYSRLMKTVDLLAANIPESNTTTISKLEFGMNIKTDKPAMDIIKENFIMHKENFLSENNKYKGQGELKRFTRSEYEIKIYDKQFQYKTPDHSLRFEIVFKGSTVLRSIGVSNLECLKAKSTLRKLFLYLLRRFNEMVIIDDFYYLSIRKDRYLLYKYTNPLYWQSISRKSNQTKLYHREKFHKIIEMHGLNQTKLVIKQSLIRKFATLLNN